MSSYVSQLQTRLKEVGLYTGKIDGIAGKLTVKAVELAIKRGVCTKDEQKDVSVIHATDPTVDGNEHLLNLTDNAVDIAPKNKPTYSLSELSLSRLKGVNPNLVKVVKRAIEVTGVDFRVQEGLRTKERQALLVKQGKSKTMNSRHLTGDAVDLVAIVDGQVSWDFNHYYTIAQAIAQASTELGVSVRWGGAWTVITNKNGTPQEWVKAYKAERKKLGKKEFLDGVHFEIPA
ncbi:M15 family metallopeptidase [Moraxella bovis]|uniref:M15 family metallopeptidase n=1 Tax=Moraxella bovis TaxID=476 RepID=UPI00227B1BDA|nr:M15 family metallopeptidase [Moraxella bovis]WAJ74592.1 M15 family metallopeptidase [Moraxella bovis]WAJ74845.1 M15 family metallopeptidase [Moraxella bovis]